jgi:hypothetical protein
MKSTLNPIRSFYYALSLLSLLFACPFVSAGLDVTSKVELLGNPFLSQWPVGSGKSYARNVWDMIAYDGKIYIGYGDASNNSPPCYVWYYNLSNGQFVNEYDTKDAQIGNFRIIDNQLYIPGYDPPSNPSYLFRLESTGWKSYRNMGPSIHVYDVYKFGGNYFTCHGPDAGASSIRMTPDVAQTWQQTQVVDANGNPTSFGIRIYTLFELGGTMYGSYGSTWMFKYLGGNKVQLAPSSKVSGLFPGSSTGGSVVRPVNYKGSTVYIGADRCNDHQWNPFGAFSATSLDSGGKRLILPGNPKPFDIIVGTDGVCYILGTIKVSSTQYVNTVCSSTDLTNWTEIFRFTSDTFARSFEMVNGNFYFGLGSGNGGSDPTSERVTASTGNFLRLKKEYYTITPPPPTDTIPAAPSNVSLLSTSSSSVNVLWSDNSTNETVFKIERKTGSGGTYSQITTVGANVTSFANTGLSASTQYFYRVRAANAIGNSAYSNEASVTTGAPTATIPAAPTSLVASATSTSVINLNWSDASSNETGFKIDRKTGAAGTYAQIATVGSNVSSYSNSGLAESTQYFYRVRAMNSAGNSGYSNEASATTQTSSGVPVVSIVATDSSAAEASANRGEFTVSRTGSTAAELKVFLTRSNPNSSTPDKEAGLTSDYTVTPTTAGIPQGSSHPNYVLIPAGSISAKIVVTPVEDTLVEGTEILDYTVKADPAYSVDSLKTKARVNILDND